MWAYSLLNSGSVDWTRLKTDGCRPRRSRTWKNDVRSVSLRCVRIFDAESLTKKVKGVQIVAEHEAGESSDSSDVQC